MIEGVKIARQIAQQPALKTRISDEYKAAASIDINDYEGTLDSIRSTAHSIYHPSGTCRMGTDASSVFDHQLRVKGVEGLRVVDASIMPEIVSGNTNAPVIMIAEKASDMILDKRSGATPFQS